MTLESFDKVEAKLDILRMGLDDIELPPTFKKKLLEKIDEVSKLMSDAVARQDAFEEANKAAGAITSTTQGIASGPKYSSVEEEEEVEPGMVHWK